MNEFRNFPGAPSTIGEASLTWDIIMGQIAISALLLSGIMFTVAGFEADYSLPKVLALALGLSICGMLLGHTIGLFALPVMLGLTLWSLHRFCYLRWKMAALVTAIYIPCQFGVALLMRPPGN